MIELRNFKRRVVDAIYSFELWRSRMHFIEGKFGSGVANYFRFLRWLFIMNTTLALFLVRCCPLFAEPGVRVICYPGYNQKNHARSTDSLASPVWIASLPCYPTRCGYDRGRKFFFLGPVHGRWIPQCYRVLYGPLLRRDCGLGLGHSVGLLPLLLCYLSRLCCGYCKKVCWVTLSLKV